jgi:hypothetical protein
VSDDPACEVDPDPEEEIESDSVLDDEDVFVAGAGSGWYVEGWSRTFCSVDAETSVDGSYAIMYPLSYNARDIGAGGRNVECFGGEIGLSVKYFGWNVR